MAQYQSVDLDRDISARRICLNLELLVTGSSSDIVFDFFYLCQFCSDTPPPLRNEHTAGKSATKGRRFTRLSVRSAGQVQATSYPTPTHPTPTAFCVHVPFGRRCTSISCIAIFHVQNRFGSQSVSAWQRLMCRCMDCDHTSRAGFHHTDKIQRFEHLLILDCCYNVHV